MIVVTSAGLYYDVSISEWCILLLTIGVVLFAELMNTAIEQLADYSCEGKYNELIKKVKDISAGAVLVLAIVALVIGGLVFRPYLLN